MNKLIYFKYITPVFVTLLVTISVLAVHLHGPLQGEFNKFFLPAKMFGVPASLKKHGIHELFEDNRNTGWDGQFYYYISNDLLAGRDTVSHLDLNAAYRYQRVGLPLIANIASRIFLQSWVSPLTYYLSGLFLILLATGCGAYLLAEKNISTWWILLWAISFGTQITQLNGLPDCAADALFIVSLIGFFKNIPWLYVTAMSLAVLSREIYILIPTCMLGCGILREIKSGNITMDFSSVRNILSKYRLQTVVISVWMMWYSWVWLRFGVSPASQADTILDWPLHQAWHFMRGGLTGNHPLYGAGREAWVEGTGIFVFIAILSLALFYSANILMSKPGFNTDERVNSGVKGMSTGIIIVVLLYVCFGPLVMKHRSGYLKVLSIFMFLIPFFSGILNRKISFFPQSILTLTAIYFLYTIWLWISQPPYVSDQKIAWAAKEPACLGRYSSEINVHPPEKEIVTGYMQRAILMPSVLMNVTVKNTSAEMFSPYQGKGSVNVGYHWLRQSNMQVYSEGDRAQLPASLRPGDSAVVPLKVRLPVRKGKYILRVSLVQEGCAWFDAADPANAHDVFYNIR